jgi:hypothetical protein
MLNPGDNRKLGCFVREAKIDNNFKLALYPKWSEVSAMMSSQICKAKEYYFKAINEPRITKLLEQNPLELAKLHHDWSELTDNWTSEFQRMSEVYTKNLLEKLVQFTDCLDPKKKISEKIERCFKPYVLEAENKRRSVFESFQKNLIDGLLWEHTTRENRKVEKGQPSVGNSTNHETSADNQPSVNAPALSWSDYVDMKFASSTSAIDQLRAETILTENKEEDDQVRSVN